MAEAGRLLITGGTGFLGRHLAVAAVGRGYRVSVTSKSDAADVLTPRGAERINVDLRDKSAANAAFAGHSFEYVINCAGYIDHTPYSKGGRDLIESHFVGLLNLLDGIPLGAVRAFVQLGSSDEYGGAPAPQREDQREAPISPYSFAKVAATQFLQTLYRTEGFPATVLRLFLVYGPGQNEARFLPQIIRGCQENREFPVSAGDQLRDFCYVDDVADGILDALSARDARGEVINLGSGRPVTIREVIETVQAIVGTGRPQFGMVPYRPGENMALYPDTKKAQKILNWKPRFELADGLRHTISSWCDSRTRAASRGNRA